MDRKMKTDCRVKDLISPLMDGELSARKEQSVRRHMADCTVCRTEYEALKSVDQLLREVNPISPSDAFARNFWRKVDAVEHKKQRWPDLADFSWGWRPKIAAAAAVLLIAVGAGIVYRSAQTTVDPTTMLIAENMTLYRDYEIINHLELFEHWDEIVSQTE